MIWAIGDLQGCYDPFKRLLKKIDFDFDRDELWIVGDLINRGKHSLETLEFVYQRRQKIKIVLGNHDIGLIAAYYGLKKSNEYIEPILNSKKVDKYIKWLRELPFFYADESVGCCMSHAGISPLFTLDDAKRWSDILQKKLQSDELKSWLKEMIQNRDMVLKFGASQKQDEYYAISSFTRMRYCYENGDLELENKNSPSSLESLKYVKPWFNIENRKQIDKKIIFGHWSTLGIYEDENVIALDSGCVWGGSLSAYNLDTGKIVSVKCQE